MAVAEHEDVDDDGSCYMAIDRVVLNVAIDV